MKKEDILFVRVMSVAAVIAAMALILMIGPGSTLFRNIVYNMNHNLAQTESISIYNLYYYQGMDGIYTVLASVSLFSAVMAIVMILTKYRGADMYAKYAIIGMIVTSLYLIAAYVLQGNIAIHRLIAGMYLDDVSDSFDAAHLMGVGVLISAILILILGILAWMILKSSRINKIENFQTVNRCSFYQTLLIIVFISIYTEWIRVRLLNGMVADNTIADTANGFLNDYYFSKNWFLNIPYVWFYTVVCALGILFRGRIQSMKDSQKYMLFAALPTVVILVRAIIFDLNRPALFGVLTLDESVCDAVDIAVIFYIVAYLTDVLFVTFTITKCLFETVSMNRLRIVLCSNLLFGILISFIFSKAVAGTMMLGLCYLAYTLANVITSVILMWNKQQQNRVIG